ncbi:phytanoyl-CoA dioxygenase family protein [Dongia sedimenti]|uniref:Phytanoyl-CoA dioxygenase family protein n=1 Tax=Dongia sedimenti TaxID=3064282 RepID=A0ABU0YWU5_9PROT|nr:phytanoyl-CoA dioxygenase family protein [Rhodospirillaceae bacterium R-7]
MDSVRVREKPFALATEEIAAYQARGVLFPRPAISAAAAQGLLQKFEALERQEGGRISKRTNHKPHLLLTWLADLVRHPTILDQVESLLGPNLLCWASDFFSKSPDDGMRVTWHQDSTYWGLSKPDIVTAWVAFTPSTVASGCLRVVPGSHLKDQLPHGDTFAADNMLSRGQEIKVAVDERDAVDVVLQPGELSLHHVRLIHGSEPNRADHRRIGFAIRYLPTSVRQTSGMRDTASLVRGRDDFGHFDLEPAPVSDFHPDAVAFHAKSYDDTTAILYAGAAQRPA